MKLRGFAVGLALSAVAAAIPGATTQTTTTAAPTSAESARLQLVAMAAAMPGTIETEPAAAQSVPTVQPVSIRTDREVSVPEADLDADVDVDKTLDNAYQSLSEACMTSTTLDCEVLVNLVRATVDTAIDCVAAAAGRVSTLALPLPEGEGVVDCDPVVELAGDLADAALLFVQRCGSRQDPTCDAVVELVLAAARTALRCFAGASAALGLDSSVSATPGLVEVDCGAAVRDALLLLDGAVRLVDECATADNPTCAAARRVLVAAAATAVDCTNQMLDEAGSNVVVSDPAEPPLVQVDCRSAVVQAREALDAAVRFAQACASRQDATCDAAVDLVEVAGATAIACAADAADEAGVEPVAVEPTVQPAPLDCAALVRLAVQTVEAVLVVVRACADGAEPTCKTVTDLLVAAAATALRCAAGVATEAGLGPAFTPPPSSLVTVDCAALVRQALATVNSLAAQVLSAIGDLADQAPSLDKAVVMANEVYLYLAERAGESTDTTRPVPTEEEALTRAVGVLAFLFSDSEISVDPHIPVSTEQLLSYALEPVLYLSQPATGGSLSFDERVLVRQALLVKAVLESQVDTAVENLVPPAETASVEVIDTPLRFPNDFEAPKAAERLANEFGTRFGGTWVLNDTVQDVLAVGVKGGSAADDARVAALFGSDAKFVKVVPVAYSEAELLAFQDAVNALRSVDAFGAMGMLGTGPDVQLNQLVVTFERDPGAGFRAELAQVVPSAALRVEVRPGIKNAVAESYESFPPYKAGKRVRDMKRGSCTSGYMYFHSSTNEPYGSFAGHCTYSNGVVRTDYNNRDYVGFSFNDRFFGRGTVVSDSALIALDVDGYATNKLYVNSDLNRSVTYAIPRSGLTSNLRPLCMRGMTTGVRCGTIAGTGRIRYVTMYDPVAGYTHTFRIENLTCWNGETNPGDSGGPVYYIPDGGRDTRTAWAAGINSTSARDSSSGKFAGESCFEPVYNTLARNTFARLKTS